MTSVFEGHGHARVTMRYEDVSQDGRVLLESLATSVNESLWREALRGHPLEDHAFAKGTHAILSRFVMEGTDGPFHVDGPFDAECRFALAHEPDAAGGVARIYLNAWVDTYAPIGRTNLAPPANAGERGCAGRVFAEHVFTNPFAPKEARKVTRLELPDGPIPPRVYVPEAAEAMLSPPAGATPIDAAPTVDPSVIVFGLRHTDSNQHVNSLVYPQLFEEAALRRFAALGEDVRLLARRLEIAYRKPCFAGQRARIALAAFRDGASLGAWGAFYAADELEALGARARPHAIVRMRFSPSR